MKAYFKITSILLLPFCLALLPNVASANRLFTSGFELFSTTGGIEWTTLNNNGTIADSTAHVRTGNYALHITAPTANVPTTLGYTFANTAGKGPYYARFYMYVASLPNVDDEIASFKNLANSTTEVFLRLQTDGKIVMINSNTGSQVGSASAAINTGQWYRVELKFDKIGGAGASTLEWKLDGTVQGTASNLTLGAGVLAFHAGTNTAGGGTSAVDIYFDDVAINDTNGSSQNGYPGAGNEILYAPSGAGDSNSMHTSTGANGTTNNYKSVNDIPPDNATSFLEGTTTASGSDFYTTAPTSTPVSLPANSTAAVVQVFSRYTGGSSSANSTFKMQLKDKSGGTASTSPAITPLSTTWFTSSTTAPFVFYTDPTGVAWTNSNLGTFQIGEQISSANTNVAKISSVWAYADYTTASSSPRAVSQNISFTYDANGNITQIVDNSNSDAAATTTYAYDDLNRLLTASSTGVAIGTNYLKSYSYDPLGNITSSSDSGTYSYAGNTGSSYANPDAPTSIGASTTLAYDYAGNLLSYKSGTSATSTYAWDYLNRMTQSVTGGAATTYGYDITNERVSAGSTMYPFIFYNTQGATTTITKHLFVNGEAIADIQGSGATTSTYYIHGDSLNSTNAVSNSLANVDQLYSYYPYGAQRIAEKNGSFTEQRQYIGQEYDVQTDLNYLNARYYQSTRGQFLSEDPVFLGDPKNQILTDPQSLNTYSYSTDNPITKSDPSGRFIPQAIVLGALYGGVSNVAFQAYADYQSGSFSGIGAYGLAAARGALTGAAIAVSPLLGVGAASGSSLLGAFWSTNGTVTYQDAVNAATEGAVTGLTAGFLKGGLAGVPGPQASEVLGGIYFSGSHGLRYAGEAGFLLGTNIYFKNIQGISQVWSSFNGVTIQSSGSAGSSQSSALSGIQNAFKPTNAAQAAAVQRVVSAFTQRRKRRQHANIEETHSYEKKKYYTDWRGLTVFFAALAILNAVVFYLQRNPSIEFFKVVIGLTAWFVFIGFGILLMTVYSYASISGTTLKFVYLLFYRRTIDINSIIEIKDAGTYKIAKNQFRSLYIIYKDKSDDIKWIELRITIFPEKTLGKLIKELKQNNPKIELNKYTEKLMQSAS